MNTQDYFGLFNFAMLSELNKNTIDAYKRINDFHQQMFEQLLGKQTDMINACVETSAHNFKLLSQLRSPQEFVTMQSDYVRDCSERWLTQVRENSNMAFNAPNQLAQIVQQNTKLFGDSLNKSTDVFKAQLEPQASKEIEEIKTAEQA